MNTEQANRLITIAVLKKKLAELEATERAAAMDGADPGDKKHAKIGEHRIGQVWLTDPSPAWKVTNRAVFNAWVTEYHPDQIETITSVYASFEKSLRDVGGYINPETGEVEPVPGMEIVPGVSTLTVKADPEAEQVIAAHLHETGQTYGSALDSIARAEISA